MIAEGEEWRGGGEVGGGNAFSVRIGRELTRVLWARESGTIGWRRRDSSCDVGGMLAACLWGVQDAVI